jgi:hypothetical protein
MELKLLLSFATSILWGLFGTISDAPGQAPSIQESKPPAVVHQLKVPSFVTSIPAGHFAGVSAPCKTLSDARKSAIDDVARQILSAVNIRYDHRYVDRISGSVWSPKRVVDDRLSKDAKGVVLGVERNIVKSSMSQDASGRHVYFILVWYSDKLISEMRRLSKGAKVVASVVGYSGNDLILDVVEVNGVEVVISSADITVSKVNRFAGFISYYIMKVPKGSQGSFTRAIGPVRVCAGSSKVRFKVSGKGKNLVDHLLGADIDAVAVLKGHDEIGRVVTAKVGF